MKKILLILLLFLTTNAFSFEQDGRWWNTLGQYEKTCYILGFSDAYGHYIPVEKDKFPYKYTYGEIKSFIDKFYSNPQYRVFYVSRALEYIIFPALKEAWSQEEIDKKALQYLKEINEGKQQ